MRTRRNLAAIGMLVVVAGVLFVWGLFFLLGDPVLRGGSGIIVALDNGSGIKRGDRVELDGVVVGTVRGVELRKPRGVAVDLRLDKGVSLAADSRAAVRTDVFGVHTIDLMPGSALVKLEHGDTIAGITVTALPDLAAEVGGRAQALLESADSLLSPETVRDLRATAAVMPQTAVELHAAFREFRGAAAALRRSSEALDQAGAGPALGRTLVELESSARAFTAAASGLDRSLTSFASVMSKVDRGEGTLGALVNDTLLYGDMRAAVGEVRALTADMRANPNRYFKVSVF